MKLESFESLCIIGSVATRLIMFLISGVHRAWMTWIGKLMIQGQTEKALAMAGITEQAIECFVEYLNCHGFDPKKPGKCLKF